VRWSAKERSWCIEDDELIVYSLRVHKDPEAMVKVFPNLGISVHRSSEQGD